MIMAIGFSTSHQQAAERMVAQDFLIGAPGLSQDLFPVRDKQKARPSPLCSTQTPVIKCCHHGLARTRCGHQQVSVASLKPFCMQLVQHVLLVALGLQIEESQAYRKPMPGLTRQRILQGSPMHGILGVIALEFTVFPQGLEIGTRPSKQFLLPLFGELHRPLQTAHHGRSRQVGTAHVGRSEATVPMEDPRLGMQTCAPAIQRNPNLHTRQPGQQVQRLHLGRAGIGGREDAQPCTRSTVSIDRGDSLQDVQQFPNPGLRDEADQDVDPVAGAQFALQLGQQGGCSSARREQPGHGQTDFRPQRHNPVSMNGLQQARRAAQKLVDTIRIKACLLTQVNRMNMGPMPCPCNIRMRGPMTHVPQQVIDQSQLTPGLLSILFAQIFQDAGQRRSQHLRHSRGGIFRSQIGHGKAMLTNRRLDELLQRIGHHLVIQTIWQKRGGFSGHVLGTLEEG